jgi:hypothetical protein
MSQLKKASVSCECGNNAGALTPPVGDQSKSIGLHALNSPVAHWLLAAQVPRNVDHSNSSFALR